MKRVLVVSAAAAVLLALSAYQNVWSKGHVPLKKVQVCHQGDPVEVITVSKNALNAHLAHGDFQLPACDFQDAPNFSHVFFTGDDCSGVSDTNDDGKADTFPDGKGRVDDDSAGCPAGQF